jgi:hypothetical protein
MNLYRGAALWNYNTFFIFQSNERNHYIGRKHVESALLHCVTYSAGIIDVEPSSAASRSIWQTMLGEYHNRQIHVHQRTTIIWSPPERNAGHGWTRVARI